MMTVDDILADKILTAELVNLYHLANGPVGYKRYPRMVKASDWFATEHDTLPVRAYLALQAALA